MMASRSVPQVPLVASALLVLVLLAISCLHVAADQHNRRPRRSLAKTIIPTKEGKRKTGRQLQWPWPEGRLGHKITNDSRDTLEPTPSPTKKPTRRPTRRPTETPTRRPTGPAAGTIYTYTDDDETPAKLPRCHGDCDDDRDCRSGLVCYQRKSDSSKEVYGCEGRAQGGKDYCVDPADLPGEPTASPTATPTPKPRRKPTPAPTFRKMDPPSPSPTAGPTAAPVVSKIPPIVNVPDGEIKEDDGDGDDSTNIFLRSVDVTAPVPEFALGLTYPDAVVVNSVFQAIINDDVRQVMTGYLNEEVGAAINTGDGPVVFEGVDLTVKPSANNRRSRLRRDLQEDSASSGSNVAKFDIGGSANLKVETDAPSDEELDDETQQQINDKVDSAVRAAVADKDKMMAYIRANASTNLLKALDGVEDPTFVNDSGRGGNVASASDGGNNSNKGSSIGQIVGFALVGVMTAGLLATGFILYKRRQYQRSQEVGVRRSVESIGDGHVKERGGVNDTHDQLDSSWAEEEYDFDDRTQDDDSFGQELQDAATVDKRAWAELDTLRDRAASTNKNVAPIPPPFGDAPHVQYSSTDGGPPSGPPSESSGGWPAGNAATIASILAATGMPRDSGADDNDSTALQEFQAVQQFVNSFEDNKVRVGGEVPHSESKEDREFLQMGMQGFYADERNPNAMYYGAGGAALAGGAGAMTAHYGAAPADSGHYDDDETIGSSVMNSDVSDVGLNDPDADKRRIGITPYGEQAQYDSPRANIDVPHNAHQHQGRESAGNNRLGINTYSELRRQEE